MRLSKNFLSSALDPGPFLAAETEGWVAFQILQDDGDLILEIESLRGSKAGHATFLALEGVASLPVDSALESVAPTEPGVEKSAPALMGETVTTEDWQVAVLDVMTGEAALQAVLSADDFNGLPDDGMVYLAALVQVRNINRHDAAVHIDSSSFQTVGSLGQLYDPPFAVEPHPALDVSLYPGGQYGGWIVVQAAEGESGVMLVFEPFLQWSGESRRYLSLEP